MINIVFVPGKPTRAGPFRRSTGWAQPHFVARGAYWRASCKWTKLYFLLFCQISTPTAPSHIAFLSFTKSYTKQDTPFQNEINCSQSYLILATHRVIISQQLPRCPPKKEWINFSLNLNSHYDLKQLNNAQHYVHRVETRLLNQCRYQNFMWPGVDGFMQRGFQFLLK